MVNTKIFATMLVILASITGTSFAAEQALPGQPLYAFKVGVNESVRGALTFGTEAQAKWEIEKIQRRAEEKKELEAQSHMTVAAKTEIESRSQDSAEKVRAVIVRLQTEGKAEAATSLEGGLHTALNAILTADTRKSEKSSDDDVSNNINVKVDSDVDAQDSSDNSADDVDVKSNAQGEVRSEAKSENSETSSSSLKSDLDIQGGLGLSVGTR